MHFMNGSGTKSGTDKNVACCKHLTKWSGLEKTVTLFDNQGTQGITGALKKKKNLKCAKSEHHLSFVFEVSAPL